MWNAAISSSRDGTLFGSLAAVSTDSGLLWWEGSCDETDGADVGATMACGG
jgi:hypothetical protein